MTDKLKIPSQKFKDVLDAFPAAIFVKDAQSNICLMNKTCEEQWGMSFQDIAGTDGSDFFPADQMAWFLEKDREIFAGGVPADFEEPFWNARLKQNRIGHTLKKPIYDSQGNPLYLIGITLDITDFKQAERDLLASDEKLRNLYELSPLGIALTDMNGTYIEFNEAFRTICGYTVDELRTLDYWALTPKEYEEQEARQLESLTKTGCYGPYEKEYRRKDGSRVPLRLNGVMVTGADGKPYVWSIVEDISEQKRTAESMKLAALIYQSSSEAIMVTDEANRIVDVNPSFTRITGYALAEIVRRAPDFLSSHHLDPELFNRVMQVLKESGRWQGEVLVNAKGGNTLTIPFTISAILNPDGAVYRYVAQFSDITEQKYKDELIWCQANHDLLTNLPNRRLFRDRLDQAIATSGETGRPVALMLVDLDRFKEINDTLGHHKGDLVLIEAARRVRSLIGASATLARLGGDEFALILAEVSDPAQVNHIAHEIVRVIACPFDLEGDTYYLSASVGITLFPDDGRDADNLLMHADRAMYLAKEQGRNRAAYYTSSMQRVAETKLALTNDLRHALARNELEVYYQPIVDLATGKTMKAEALLRWHHPQRGMVNPADFIPLAEESGLILDIGDWVFHQTIATIADWRAKFGRVISVSVNKSPLQFTADASYHSWQLALGAAGLPGDCITVEITEGMLIKDSPAVKQRLLDFRNRGIEVSIDDFGTGFSSLSYLKQFDIDYLKIDRSFIRSLVEDASDKALTEAIIVMAHKLSIKTIAEGIETEAQRDLLIQFGCDYAQGYLFAKPMTASAFEALLAAGA
jgi:diguanylate cyclase (GGDEF)-like protein/PAS domain S-box-containing protein